VERVVCTECGIRQPREWRPGELCGACGQPVRVEQQCPWCSSYSPAGRFCKKCGCELVAPLQFGAARMLKDAGVDRFSLGARLRELDPEQVATLQRRYDEQRAIVMRRVDEAWLCEQQLLQRGYADALEQQLVDVLPIDDASIADLAGGPAAPFNVVSQLDEIFRSSPVAGNRDLAALALLRRDSDDREALRCALGLLHGDGPHATEAALVFGQWRFQQSADGWPHGLEPRPLLALSQAAQKQSTTRLWGAATAAAALQLSLLGHWGGVQRDEAAQQFETLLPLLREGVDSTDPALRLACIFALGDESLLRSLLDHDAAPLREAAVHALSVRGLALPELLERAAAGPAAEVQRIVERAPDPLLLPAVQAVLAAMRRADPKLLHRLWQRLKHGDYYSFDVDSRHALGHWIADHGPARLSAEQLLELLDWACRPAGTRHSSQIEPPATDEAALLIVDATSRALAGLDSAGRCEIGHSSGFIKWLWLAVGPTADAALDRWAADPDPKVGAKLFETLSSLDAYIERMETSDLPRGWQIGMALWDRATASDRPRIACHIASGWSWGYTQDAASNLAAWNERYLHHAEERALIRLIMRRAHDREGTAWLDGADQLAPGEPPAGPDPILAFRQLCEAAPDQAYEHVRLVLTGIELKNAAEIARLLFAHQVGRPGEPTQQLPPLVAYARWLDETTAALDDAVPLAETTAVFEPAWSALDIQVSRESANNYYAQEKREEISDILQRVRARLTK